MRSSIRVGARGADLMCTVINDATYDLENRRQKPTATIQQDLRGRSKN